jgi:hypothetical protein
MPHVCISIHAFVFHLKIPPIPLSTLLSQF